MAKELKNSHPTAMLACDLRQAIERNEFQPGERIATLRNLSEQYGVTFGQARSAINQLVKEGLLVSRRGSGVYVAKREHSPSGNSFPSRWVALLLSSQDHLYGPMTESIIEQLEDQDFSPIKASTNWDRNEGQKRIEKLIKQWHQSPPYALLIQNFSPSIDKLIGSLDTRIIAVLRQLPSSDTPWHNIDLDYQRIGQTAAKWALDRGHQRVGIIVPGIARELNNPNAELISGVENTLKETGLANPVKVHYQGKDPSGKPTGRPLAPPSINHLEKWLAEPDRPTALLGVDARIVSATRAAANLGLNPFKDLDLLGIGDTPWSQTLNFSSISIQPELIVKRVTELATMPKEPGGDSLFQIKIPGKLVLR